VSDATTEREKRWAIILAGGEGSRLRSLTRKITGQEVPKQFCPILGRTTLFEQTRQRAVSLVSDDRIMTVLSLAHEPFYMPLFANTPQSHLVVQPINRGTSPAIVYALMRLARMAPQALVAILPSDHYVKNDFLFNHYVDKAFEMAKYKSEFVTLLGIAPKQPEAGYGWIEPGVQVYQTPEIRLFSVKKFWEKPPAQLARQFWEAGFLWNSFVMVGRVSTLLELTSEATPYLYQAFAKIEPLLGTFGEKEAIAEIYSHLNTLDFSSHVLAKLPHRLAVLPIHGVEWSDLGEPQRVFEVLCKEGLHVEWANA